MRHGKQTCKILKEIRSQIAAANDIEFVVDECRYKGDCLGTCPRCEAEVRYLEQQLSCRMAAGKAISLVGLSLSVAAMATQFSSCGTSTPTNTNNTTTDIVQLEDVVQGILQAEEPIQDTIPAKSKNRFVVSDTLYHAMEGLVIRPETLDTVAVDENPPVYFAEEMPSFQGGGIDSFREWCDENLVYPQIAKDNHTQGRVFISFIIECDGSLSSVNVVRSSAELSLDTAAVNVVRSSPLWSPACDGGKSVRFAYNVPVNFSLSE